MNALWVADDVDDGWEKEFEVGWDRLTKELDTIRTELNNIKIYADPSCKRHARIATLS